MKRWLALALMLPTAASAGPFTFTEISAGPVDFGFSFTWPAVVLGGASDFTGSAVFEFVDATEVSPLGRQLCVDADGCFEGFFQTNNAGFGTYTAAIYLDESSCVVGAPVPFPLASSPYYTTVNRTACEVRQLVEATFADTGVVYTGTATIGTLAYAEVSDPSGTERFGAPVDTVNYPAVYTPTGFATLFDGTMSVAGTACESSPLCTWTETP